VDTLLFIGIIVLFSIIDAVAKKGRAGKGGEEELPFPPGPGPEAPPRRASPTASGPRVPSYDDDPSFDDAVATDPARPPRSSEGMIPADVWEEIQNLARGGQAEAPSRAGPPDRGRRPVPEGASARPRPPRPAQGAKVRTGSDRAAPPPLPAPRGTPSQAAPPRRGYAPAPAAPSTTSAAPPAPAPVSRTAPVHEVHLSHPKYGTPMAGRLTGFAEGAPPGERPGSGLLHQLRSKDPAQLRQAVLLGEILGPPVALQEERSDPKF
jgi:hypothetical protein